MGNSTTIDHIDHRAEVVSASIDKKSLEVKILDEVNCQSCPAEALCLLSHKQDKNVRISTPLVSKFKSGDNVLIRGVETLPNKFMLIATILPCIILITSMIIVYLLTLNQVFALICGIGITLILFILIWSSRNRVTHEFVFSIIGHKNKKQAIQ
ncbi:MAG: SoxR reducing system RseC family protein [Muribaculaceae bacterium]|nr:SoxR reducing system RseC family protein [Muribaculaceae bacterium]MDE6770912.1 SoxR reducing system RseC family protein [Muribaculaceae bacterium]